MAKHNIKANKIQLDELNGNLPVIGSDKPIRQNGVYSYDDFDLVPKWLVNQLLSELDFPDGVIENGGINVSDIDDGNISLGLFQWRLTVDGVQSIYSNSSGVTFNDIELSAPGLVRYNAFFGDDEGVISMVTGDEGEVAVLPDTPENTVILGWVIITDAGADVPVIPSPGYATLGSNNFAGNQNVQGFVRANYFDANKGVYLISGRGSDPSTDTFLMSGYKNTGQNSFIGIQRAFGDYGFLFRIDSVTGVLDLIANPTVNGVPIGGGSTISAGTTSGTATAYTATLSPAITAYNTNDIYLIQFNVASGASPTINLNSLGAKSLVGRTGSAIGANQLRTDIKYLFVYDGTNVKLISEAISPDALLETQTTPTEDGLSVSRRGLIYYWNWLKTQAINWGNTFQATRFGAGIAPNVAAKVTVAANTSSESQLLLTPSSTDVSTSVAGHVWNNGGVIKFRDTTGQVDLLKSDRNPTLVSSNSSNFLLSSADGSIAVGGRVINKEITDTDIINAITGATYTDNRATISVSGKTAYTGQVYNPTTGIYNYYVQSDNVIRRF